MSEVCRLTLPRTASGPTETFQFKQSRPRAAMRWRGGLGSFLLQDCSLTFCTLSFSFYCVGFYFAPLFLLCSLSLCSCRFDFHSVLSFLVVAGLRSGCCCRCGGLRWGFVFFLRAAFHEFPRLRFLFSAALQEFPVVFFRVRA